MTELLTLTRLDFTHTSALVEIMRLHGVWLSTSLDHNFDVPTFIESISQFPKNICEEEIHRGGDLTFPEQTTDPHKLVCFTLMMGQEVVAVSYAKTVNLSATRVVVPHAENGYAIQDPAIETPAYYTVSTYAAVAAQAGQTVAYPLVGFELGGSYIEPRFRQNGHFSILSLGRVAGVLSVLPPTAFTPPEAPMNTAIIVSAHGNHINHPLLATLQVGDTLSPHDLALRGIPPATVGIPRPDSVASQVMAQKLGLRYVGNSAVTLGPSYLTSPCDLATNFAQATESKLARQTQCNHVQ